MGKLSREKGAAFEREVCAMFREAGIPMLRTLTETRDANIGDLRGEAPVVIQCKVGGCPSPYAALREAIAAARPGEHPVAAVRFNRQNGRGKLDMAVLPLADLIEIAAVLKQEKVW